ncbi:MAG: response regulator [Thermomicrobiales bacterium]
MIRILLVDDHAAFRQPFAFILDREPDLAVVGQAGSLAEAMRIKTEFDVATVDLTLEDGNGVDVVRSLRASNPSGSVCVLTASQDPADRAMAVEAGAAGLLHKSASLPEIIAAVRRLAAGEQLFNLQEIIELLRLAGQQRERDRAAQHALAQLTPRERDVLNALAKGMTDREIGEYLNISSETVRTHMVNILHKLGVESRLAALVFAVRHGAVKIE